MMMKTILRIDGDEEEQQSPPPPQRAIGNAVYVFTPPSLAVCCVQGCRMYSSNLRRTPWDLGFPVRSTFHIISIFTGRTVVNDLIHGLVYGDLESSFLLTLNFGRASLQDVISILA